LLLDGALRGFTGVDLGGEVEGSEDVDVDLRVEVKGVVPDCGEEGQLRGDAWRRW